MKYILIALFLVINVFAEEKKEETDILPVKTKDRIIFENGFGTVRAKPILREKNLEKKITLLGEYNVNEKNNNAKISFDKVEYKGEVYNLRTPFYKKGRLKSKSATVDVDTQLIVQGGNKEELLNILNQAEKLQREKVAANKDKKGSNKYSVPLTTGNDNSYNTGNGYNPSNSSYRDYFGNNNSNNGSSSNGDNEDNEDNEDKDNNNSQTDNNGAITIKCDPPSYLNGIATYYEVIGNFCIEKKTNSVEKKFNSKSCLNKIDYDNNKIELGYELFAHSPDGGTYMVQGCRYEDPIELKSEVSNCRAIPNYTKNTAEILKRYFYNFENEKTYVGECTPSNEIVNINYNLNECSKDRHDFEKNVSVAQGQYFYSYENKNYNIGNCVDVPRYTYNHYFDDVGCDYDIVNDRVMYRQRVAYDDLIGTKKYATDCQVTNSGGIKIIEEFAGYEYHPSTKQALRKINNYFIVPNTNKRIDLDKNKVTSKSYQYVEEQCKVVNDDKARLTTFWTQTFFNDTDENKKVIISDCQIKNTIGYTQVTGTGNGVFIGSLGYKRLNKTSDNKYHIWTESDKIINHDNGLFPSLKGSKIDVGIKRRDCKNMFDNNKIKEYALSSNSCIGGTLKKTIAGYYYPYRGGQCGFYDKQAIKEHLPHYSFICNQYNYWEEIGEYSNQATYLRGDGTTLKLEAKKIYRILK